MNNVGAPESNETMQPPPLQAAAPHASSFGARLATERQRLGLSINEIAARLRLHPRQIEAIEQETLERLPQGPFVRGFIRNYAKELRLEPEPLLEDLRRRLAGPGEDPGAPTATAETPLPMFRIAIAEQISRPVVITVVLALLIALAIIGSLSTRDRPTSTVAQSPAVVSATSAEATASNQPSPASAASAQEGAPPSADGAQSPVAQNPGPPNPDAQTAAAATTGPQRAAPAAGVVGEAPVPTAAPSIASTAAATAVEKRGPTTASNLLRLRFTDEAWVEVTQSDGRILLSQLNAPGTEQRLDGKPPLKLVIGNAQGVALEYRGKRIDLAPRTNADNVARITLD